MKKIVLSILFISILFIANEVGASSQSYFVVNNAEATTTLSTINPSTGSTTSSFIISDADYLQLNLQFTASTSASVLNWYYQYSDNKIDWFTEDEINAYTPGTFSLTHSSSTIVHTIQGNNTSSTTRKKIVIPNLSANHIRVVFSTTVGTSTIWSQIVKKINSY